MCLFSGIGMRSGNRCSGCECVVAADLSPPCPVGLLNAGWCGTGLAVTLLSCWLFDVSHVPLLATYLDGDLFTK